MGRLSLWLAVLSLNYYSDSLSNLLAVYYVNTFSQDYLK